MMKEKNKNRNNAAVSVMRDGHHANSQRGGAKRHPSRTRDGDRLQTTTPQVERDRRWDELAATLRNRFPGCEDPDTWRKLRAHFDSGVLRPELNCALRSVQTDHFCFGPPPPRSLSELAENAEELGSCASSFLAELLEDLLVMRDRIEHDAARALAGFGQALRWAEDQPDLAKALLCDIDEEPGLRSTAVWPRLGILFSLYGPQVLDRFPEEAAGLVRAARAELAGRPRPAPAWLYPMLGMGPGDGAYLESVAHESTVIENALEMVAHQFGELMFALGPAPARRHADNGGAPAGAGANPATAAS